MSKRRRDSDESDASTRKRRRDSSAGSIDRLSCLSNELLLHILSFLPISSLSVCQRLSRRFNTLSGDSELWKRQYYTQWVLPRARRLASVRRSSFQNKTEYSPKVSTWLDHGHLAADGKVTNWKGQYRLRHNWSPKLCAGIVFTADSDHGLQAWAAKDPANCLATVSFSKGSGLSKICPTALAVSDLKGSQEIVVGFENGHYNRYIMDDETSQLGFRSCHKGSGEGAITAMAICSPYLLMVSHDKILSLHYIHPEKTSELRELASLKADNMIAPLTLSLRTSNSEIVATIVYSFFHIGCGWSLGIQELHFSKLGQQLQSRLTSTVDSQYGMRPLRNLPSSTRRRHSALADPHGQSNTEVPVMPSILHQQPPTSMSYSHPYLLTSHADNTLTMYLVVSNSNDLFVRGGQRLWGHTSSVSTVQVTNRGKAISVGSRGDEIRIWELEMAIPSLGTSRPLNDESSIQVNPGNKEEDLHFASPPKRSRPDARGFELDSDLEQDFPSSQQCIGFDDERVLLLREKPVGTQLLECYDFT
ncbi:hypothetical protein N7450_002303 [Penicillium hetheringtonii]|uniref:Probable E3 ubiquitin ligase complex SCF subunit sconB n=1 Tax=Penicillium hetheringtonii TaxID=911720 RepID=A0AAD6DVL1_9EURO|nr:hypothetical protein N7450_002303 [Penicillium hetheringtonii]